MDKCPHCGGHLGRDPVEEELEKLREECRQQGFVASWDGWINPRAAAHLLNRSTDTLRGWRNIGKHLDLHRKTAGRNEYSLPAIAKWIVSNTEE